jgi:hypothetical protein
MYSVEYRCTSVETVSTTTNMVNVRASIEKFQFTSNRSERTQFPKVATVTSPLTITGKQAKRYSRAALMLMMIRAASCCQETNRLDVSINRKFKSGRIRSSSVRVMQAVNWKLDLAVNGLLGRLDYQLLWVGA